MQNLIDTTFAFAKQVGELYTLYQSQFAISIKRFISFLDFFSFWKYSN